MMPGILINISFVMACGLTGLIFLLERRNGMFERMMVCGVTKSQVIIAHTIYRIGTMSVLNVITLTCQYGVINVFRFTFKRVNLLNFCNIDTTEFLR